LLRVNPINLEVLVMMTSKNQPRLTWIAFALGVAFSASTQAQSLFDVWSKAQSSAAEIVAAQAQRDESLQSRSQKDHLWDAHAQATVAAGVAGQDMRVTRASAMGMNDVDFTTSITAGVQTRASVGIQKPARNEALSVQEQIIELSSQMGDLQFAQAQENITWQVVQSYFDSLLIKQQLSILEHQYQTLNKATTELQRRQQVGDATLMDVQAAQIKLAVIQASQLQLQQQLASKLVSLQQLTGWESISVQIQPLRGVDKLSIGPLPQWQKDATDHSMILKLSDLQLQIQSKEIERIGVTGTTPTMDWIAQAQADRLTGWGMVSGGTATQQMAGYVVGAQLTIPLGAHGLNDEKQKTALKHLDKLQSDRDWAVSNLTMQVKDAWQNVNAQMAQLPAFERANQISAQRLQLTRQAHTTGVRTTTEWLGAEQDASQAEWALRQAQLQTLLSKARLQWLSGNLHEAQLQELTIQLSASEKSKR
jgi:outer membrane protein TolC